MAVKRPKRRTGVKSRFKHQDRREQVIRPKKKKHKSIFRKVREAIGRRRERVSLAGRAKRIAAQRKSEHR